jgi:hypothetical protein
MKTAFTAILAAVTLAACGGRAPEELTAIKPYADRIGTEYRVLTDDVHAHGVYGEWPDRTVTSVTVDRSTQFRGHQVAFRRQLQKGAVIRILSAWRRSRPLGSDIYYLVEIPGTDLPSGAPVELPLADGNDGTDGELNPVAYRRLPGSALR